MNDELTKLYSKIKEEMESRKIKSLSGSFSIYGKRLIVNINDVEHDLSKDVPEEVWRKETFGNDYLLNNPVINYNIRVELSKIANKYIKSFDPTFEGVIVL